LSANRNSLAGNEIPPVACLANNDQLANNEPQQASGLGLQLAQSPFTSDGLCGAAGAQTEAPRTLMRPIAELEWNEETATFLPSLKFN
jgi:hypothetical protein